jgi:hypothetical protein
MLVLLLLLLLRGPHAKDSSPMDGGFKSATA